jgi:hypothetical protein
MCASLTLLYLTFCAPHGAGPHHYMYTAPRSIARQSPTETSSEINCTTPRFRPKTFHVRCPEPGHKTKKVLHTPARTGPKASTCLGGDVLRLCKQRRVLRPYRVAASNFHGSPWTSGPIRRCQVRTHLRLPTAPATPACLLAPGKPLVATRGAGAVALYGVGGIGERGSITAPGGNFAWASMTELRKP